MRISDWSSDVCSSDLGGFLSQQLGRFLRIEHAVLHLLHAQLEIADEVPGFVDHLALDLESSSSSEISPRVTAMPFSVSYLSGKIGRASCRERVCQYV